MAKPKTRSPMQPKSKKPYDYVNAAWVAVGYERNGSMRAPVKRILRKLVRKAAIESVVHWQMDYDKTTRTGLTLGQIADAIAKRLVP